MKDDAKARIEETQRAIASAARPMSKDVRRWGERLATAASTAGENLSRNLAYSQGLDRQMVLMAARNAPKLPGSSSTQTVPSRSLKKAGEAAHPAARPTGIRAGIERVAAATDGAVDAATLDLGDYLTAFKLTSHGLGPGRDPIERYKWWMAQSEAQEARDRELYPNSRKAGQVAGVVAPLVLTGGASAAPQGAVRIAPLAAKSVGLSARSLAQRFGPQAAVGLGGALASAGAQVATDLVDPTRSVNVADTLGAFLGGGVGSMTTLYRGPRAGTAAEALTTELTRSALSGEPISWDAIGDSAVAGTYAGRLAGGLGVNWSNNLPSSKYRKGGRKMSKEELGDWMGETLSRLRLEGVAKKRQQYFKVSGGNTRADHVTMHGEPRENKFGYSAKLSKRQLEAMAELARYRVSHLTPDDIGKASDGVAAILAGQTASRPEQRQAPPKTPPRF